MENGASFKKGKKPGPGRPKGLPNKATVAAREAIALFVDNNAGRLQVWLDKIADGDPKAKPNPIAPNPARAFELFQSVVEYHVPKLARTEVKHEGEVGLTVNILKFSADDHASK